MQHNLFLQLLVICMFEEHLDDLELPLDQDFCAEPLRLDHVFGQDLPLREHFGASVERTLLPDHLSVATPHCIGLERLNALD